VVCVPWACALNKRTGAVSHRGASRGFAYKGGNPAIAQAGGEVTPIDPPAGATNEVAAGLRICGQVARRGLSCYPAFSIICISCGVQ